MPFKPMISFVTVCCFAIQAAGQLQFDPQLGGQIEFPDTPVGDVAQLPLTARNQTNTPVTVILNAAPDQFGVQPNQLQIQPNMVGVFTLSFSPDEEGQHRGNLSGVARFGNAIMRLPVTRLVGVGADAGNPEIRVQPERIGFVIEQPDQREAARIVVSNVGDAPLELLYLHDFVEWLEADPEEGEVVIEQDGDDLEIGLNTTDNLPDNGDYETRFIFRSNDEDNPEIIVPITLTVDLPEPDPQVIELEEGWNMISANRDFDEDFIGRQGPDMQSILADILDRVILIKDGFGRFCYPEFDFWGIRSWDGQSGYQIKVTEEAELEIHGEPIPFDRPIELVEGWNLIAYYPDYRIRLMEIAFEDLTRRDLLLLAKDGQGRFYWPEGGWGMVPTEPGQGYLVKVTEACEFQWAAEQDDDGGAAGGDMTDELRHFDDPPNTGVNMSVLLQRINGIEIVEGAEFAAVLEDGTVAGATALYGEPGDPSWGMAVWGDENGTEVIEGYRHDEPLTFLYWDPRYDWELEVDFDVVDGGEPVYRQDTILLLDVRVSAGTDDSILPNEFGIERIYPNPFNNRASVEFFLPYSAQVEIKLFTPAGRELRSWISGIEPAGRRQFTFDGSGLAAGQYYIAMSFGDSRSVQSVVLVK